MKKIITTLIILIFSVSFTYSQVETPLTLEEKIEQSRIVWLENRRIAEEYAKENGLPIKKTLEDGTVIEIHSIRDNGIPLYYITQNANAARTVGANRVYSGGGAGLSLSGSGITLGIWDEARVRTTHQEFTSSRATQQDSPSGFSSHSTHVGGTMIAAGVNSSAKGMSYAANLNCYDWNSDQSEMRSAAASGLKVSNHSYGYITGWIRDGYWYWYGDVDVSSSEDAEFGYYSYLSEDVDDIAYDYPNYLICVSAGNDRGEGPSAGTGHYYFDDYGNEVWSTATREKDGGNDGYDCLSHMGVAKNLLVVGAVNDITSGYSTPSNVVMTSFSSWGPTDDGRIKPDIVANGYALFSSLATSNTSYQYYSGTSMACPNTSGALGLLLEHHEDLHGSSATMKSATLKGIVIHTAHEAGSNDGPDYKFGWGLLNIEGAADLMTTNANRSEDYDIQELTLSSSETEEITGYSDGSAPIKVTICWTDPAASPSTLSLNSRTSKLINDLDLRITRSSNTYYPYKLSYSNPGNAATTGDNDVDNVEQVYIESPSAGTYTISINHEGSLSGGSQNFSVIISGLEPVSEPIVSSQPEDSQVCPGSSTDFTAEVAGEVDEYLWYFSDDNGTSWSEASDSYYYSGYETSSLSVSNIGGDMNGYLFRLMADNSYGTTYSDPAELSVYQNATISSHPLSQDINAGEDTYFSVTDVGGDSYRWQVSTDNGDTWSYISNGGVYSNETTSTLNLNDVPLSYSGYWYRAEVSNVCGFETYSNSADINVSGYIEVFYHPDNYTTCIGEDAYLYAVILGEPDPALQWQVSTNDGGNWSNISNGSRYAGVTTNTLTIYSPSEDMQDYLYRLSGTNSVGTVQTNSASVILEDELVVISHPGNASVSAGDYHTFTADIGDPDEMNWQISTDNGNTWDWLNNDSPYSGAYTQSLLIEYITANMDGYQYRLVGFNTCPDGATTNAAQLTVETSLSITSNPDDTEACRDGQAFFEGNVESIPEPELQWQVSTDNGNSWTGLSDNDVYDGTSTETLEIISAQSYMDGFLYRLYATNNYDEAVSEAAELHITPVPLITEDLSNQTACEGGEAIFEFQVDGDDLNFTWYYSTNNGTSWIEIFNNDTFSGANTNALTINTINIEMDDHIFFCLIENICEDMETTDFVGLNVLENADITDPEDQEICNGGTVDISASVSGIGNIQYLWQRSINNGANWSNLSNNDVFSGVTTLTLTIATAIAQYDGDLFRLRVTNDCGTSYSQPAQLSITNPILVDAGDDIDLCYGEEVDIEVSVSGGDSPYQYYWTPSTGLNSTNVPNPTASPTETTTYTVYVTDSEGCQGSDQITVNVNPELFVDAGNNVFICFGSEVEMRASVSGGGRRYEYSWSPTTGLSNPEILNPIANPTVTTEYTLTITDSKGCVVSDGMTVEVNPELIANAGADEFICYGSEVQLQGSIIGGDNNLEYSWSPSTGLSDPNILNPVADPAETTTYTLTVIDGQGCSKTDEVIIEVNPELIASAGNNKNLCYGGEVQLDGSASGGNGQYQYLWSPSTGLSSTTIATPLASPLETITYTLTVTDGEGCVSVDQVHVEVNNAVFVDAGTDLLVCYDSEEQFDIIVEGGTPPYNYYWTPADGLSDQFVKNPVVSPEQAATTYTVYVTDSQNCTGSDEIVVSLNPELFANAGADEFICYGSEVQLQGSIIGGDNNLEYSWSPSTGLSDPNILNPVADPAETTTYTLTVIDGQGCSKTDEVIIEVNPELIASAGNNKNLCYGGEVQLDGSVSGGNGQYQYSWSPSTGLSSTTIATPLASPLETITYTLTVTDGEGCVSVDQVQVEVNNAVFVDAGTDLLVCYDSEEQFDIIVEGGTPPYNYYWTPADGLSDQFVRNPVVSPEQAATIYTVYVTDSQNCTGSDEIDVSLNPELFVNAGDDEFICYGSEVQLQGSISGGDNNLEYSWSPSTGLSDPNILNPVADPAETTTYTLTVIDGQGCSKTDEVIIEVNPELIASAGNNKNLCYGGEVQLDGSASGGNGQYQYSWSPSTGLSSTTIATPIASPLETITYTLTVTDGEECVSVDQVQVEVNNAVFVDAGADLLVCYDSEEQFDIIVEGGTPPYNYYWTPADGLSDQFVKNPVVSPEQAATTYTVYVTDSQNCTGSDEIVVSLNPELFVNAGADEFICYGSEVQLQGSISGGDNDLEYSWSPSTGLSDPNILNPVADPAETTTYTLTVIDVQGCSKTDEVIVEVNPELIASAGNNKNLCYGGEVQLDGSASGGNGQYQYSWSPSTGLTSTTIATPLASPLETITYTLTVTDGEGCVSVDQVHVEVNNAIFVDAGTDLLVCYDSEEQFDIIVEGGTPPYNYYWTPADGLSDQFVRNPVVSPEQAATTYTVYVTDSQNCTGSDEIVVSLNPELFANAGDDEFICYGSEVQLNGPADGGSEIYQYSWTPVDALDDPNSPDPVANPTVTTEYTLTVTDSEGCVVSDQMTVEVNPELFANAGDDEFICYGSEVHLNGSADGGSDIYQYSWTPVDALDDPNSPDPIANPTVTTEYTLTVTDSEGCVVSDVMTVEVNPQLFANAGADEFICYGSEVQLQGSISGGDNNLEYSWSPSTGLSDPNILNPVADPAETTTYTLTVIDGQGCSKTDEVIIEVNPELIASAGNNKNLCYGGEVQLDGSASGGNGQYQYLWSPSTGLSSTTIATPLASPLETITYTLTVTDGEGCVSVDQVQVEVNNAVFIDAGTDLLVCYDSEEQFDIIVEGGTPPYNYYWTPADGLSDQFVRNPVVSPEQAATTYTVYVTDSQNCTGSDEIVVSLNPELFANAGDDEFICYGSEVQLNGPADGGSEIYQYSWTPVDGLDDPNSPNPIANPTVTTEYTLTVTDSEGCVVSDQMTVVVNPELFVNAGANEFICYGSEVQLDGSADGGSEIYQYSWTPVDGLDDPNSPDPVANPTVTTEYTLTVTDSEGCVVSDMMTVEVNPELFVNAGADEFICYGSEAQLNGSADGGSEIYQYSWTPVDGLDDPNSPDPIANPTVTTEYTLTVTDSEGCVVSDQMTVVVNPELFVNAGANEFICYGSEIQLDGSADGGSEIYQYSWTPVDGLDDPNSPNPIANPTVTTEYTLTVTDSEGCVVSDMMTVEVNPQLFANAGADEFICYGSEVQLNGSADGGSEIYQYSWTPVDALDDPSSPDPIANPTVTTEYTLTITDSEGCVVSDQMTVVVNPQLFANAGADEFICYGSEVHLNGSADGGSEIYQYSWTPVDGLDDPNSPDPVANPTVTTEYTLTVTDSEGCVVSDQMTVVVNPELFANAGDDEFICYGSEVQLNGSADGGSEIYQYSWTPVDGLDDSNSPDPVANPTVTTEYTLTVTDSEGCEVSDVMTVEVNPELFANAGADEFICYGSEVHLNGSADGGSEIYQYSWTPVDGLDDPSSPDPVANPTVTTEYTLTITDSEGCVVSDQMTVVVNPQLFANAGADEFICYGSEVQLDGSADGGSEIYQYSWTPVDGLDDPNSPDPIANPTVTTEYTLTITDSEGCVVSDQMTVTVHPLPEPEISGDEEVNSHTNHEYTTEVDEIMEIEWIVEGGTINGRDSDETVEIDWGSAGIGKLKLILTNSESGCKDSTEIEVQINLFISLDQRWNWISSYLEPESLDLDDIFQDVIDDLLLVRDRSGNIYFPSMNINTIGEWDIRQGYKVYMMNETYLVIKGEKLEPEDNTLYLNQQWNMISYLRDSEMDINTALEIIIDEILIVRDESGNIFMPELDINTIGDMMPTQAYDIYLNNDTELTYPENDYNPRAIHFNQISELPEPKYLRASKKATSVHHSFIVELPKENDGNEVAIYNDHEELISSGVFLNGFAILTVWGDDDKTPTMDGPKEGELLTIKILDQRTQEMSTLDNIVIKDLRSDLSLNDLFYQKGGIVRIQSKDIIGSDQLMITASPNPVSNLTTIEYYLPLSGFADITLYSSEGKAIENLSNSYHDAGTHSCSLDVKLIPSGKYSLVVKQNERIYSIPLLIVK
jgi:peptide deformylase